MRYVLVGATAAMALLGAAVLATAHAQEDKGRGPAPEGKGPAAGGRDVQRGPSSGESERSKQPAQAPKAERREDGPAKGAQGNQRGQERPQAGQPERDRQKAAEPKQEREQPKAARQQERDKAQRDQQDRQKADRDQKERQKAQQQQQDRDGTKATEQQRKDDRSKTTQGKDRPDGKSDRVRTQVSEQQRGSAAKRIRDQRVERIGRSRINVDVRVGSRLPRSIHLHVLPVVIYDDAPAYRGYSYVLLDDDTILIIDASTYDIVDVIPAGSLRADLPGGALALSVDQMRFVFTNVRRDRTADVRVRLALGAEVPRSVELLQFPDDVIGRIGELGRYRYIVSQNDVVIVDPDDYAVVLVISN